MHCSLLRGMVGRLMSDRERERLLHELSDLVPTDLRRIELHARQGRLDGGGEQIICSLVDLDPRGLIHAARGVHGELRVDFSLDARAPKRLGILWCHCSRRHRGGLLYLKREVRLGVRDRSLSTYDTIRDTAFDALSAEVSDVRDFLGKIDVGDLDGND